MKKLDMNRIGDFKIQKYNSSNRTNSKSNGNSRLGGKAKQAYRSGTKSHTDDYVRNPGLSYESVHRLLFKSLDGYESAIISFMREKARCEKRYAGLLEKLFSKICFKRKIEEWLYEAESQEDIKRWLRRIDHYARYHKYYNENVDAIVESRKRSLIQSIPSLCF